MTIAVGPAEAPRCSGNPSSCGACANDTDCARFAGTVCYNGQCVECNPERQEGRQGCENNERCCLDRLETPGCVSALASQYCQSCNAENSCGVGADTCTGFECQCGAAAACGGPTPFCVVQNGVSRCSECIDNADCLGNQRGEFCAADNTCQNCIDAGFDCGNQAVCVQGGQQDGRCGECSPNGDAQDACDQDSSRPYCSPATAECLGCHQTPNGANGCLGNRNGPICASAPNHPLLGQCLTCDPKDPQDGNCVNPSPVCANSGQCRACNSEAVEDECPGNAVCQADGTCAED